MSIPKKDRHIAAFSQLGKIFDFLSTDSPWPGFSCGLMQEEYVAFQHLIDTHFQTNGWFTAENIKKSLAAWSKALTQTNLEKWLSEYPEKTKNPKNIGIICAGNIPMVGFHDVLSVLLSGHRALIKLSSDDDKLIPAILQMATKLNPELKEQYEIIPSRMTGFEAVIATGSSNTGRYFHYYFKDIPHIIRKSRTSVAILSGDESEEELKALSTDIFDYFGLGCRSISKIYIPENYDLDSFFRAIYEHHPIINHNKYANNYDYNKAVWLLNNENLLDNGFILLKEEASIASPTASLYYERYNDREKLNAFLKTEVENIQCIVGSGEIPFGQAQCPMLWDYADNIDTMKFLSEL